LLAQSAHDGLAQAIRPAHTRSDGDFAAVLATGEVDAHPDRLRVAASDVVVQAIRAAVQGSP
jgi:L-aminopeptidase/D-esterase-like protein